MTNSPNAAVALLEDTKAILDKLIAFPSVSSQSNLDLIAYAAEKLEACGARVSVFHDPTKTMANLFATIGPEIDGGIVLSGHTDVVPADASEWTSDPFVMREEEDLLYRFIYELTHSMIQGKAVRDVNRPASAARSCQARDVASAIAS